MAKAPVSRSALQRQPNKSRLGKGTKPHGRPKFKTSRLQDKPTSENADLSDEQSINGEEVSDAGLEESNQSASDEEEYRQHCHSALLQALNGHGELSDHRRKRRKLSPDVVHSEERKKTSPGSNVPEPSSTNDVQQQDADNFMPMGETDGEEADTGAPNESLGLPVPYDWHFESENESQLQAVIESVRAKRVSQKKSEVMEGVRREMLSWAPEILAPKIHPLDGIKQRLIQSSVRDTITSSALASDLSEAMLKYEDICLAYRTVSNSKFLRDVSVLHALNHVYLTRDRVIKNNEKIAQAGEDDTREYRDQGFTRPKVLVILPTRQSCVQWMEAVFQISNVEQQENKARFYEQYYADDEPAWESKPEDFRELFAGNSDDNFRVGLKFNRKNVKIFSSFYNSDIILASALGLTQVLEGTTKSDKKTAPDADFLSSIEIVIIDNATAVQMQNWHHVEFIFSKLSSTPNDLHGADIERVRPWFLDANAKYLRQTIILSSFITPEVNSLITNHTFNTAGRVKYTPTYTGTMLDLPPSILPGALTQSFQRFHSPSPLTDPDLRFNHFTAVVLPTVLATDNTNTKSSPTGTLIFVPSYTSFLRLRNYLTTSLSTAAISLTFAALSEYTPTPELARARSHFLSGRHSTLLYTERLHHFRRLNLKGVKQVIFYGLPENPLFYSEILGWLAATEEFERTKRADATRAGETARKSNGATGKGKVRALFSKWDVLKLERIVGTERVGRLVAGDGRADGDVFEFT